MLNLNRIFVVKFVIYSKRILRRHIRYDTVNLKLLFLHFLMMWTALIMSSCLNKIRHNFEYTAESLFSVFGCKFSLKELQENSIFKLLFLSPMSLFLISNIVVKKRFLNYEWENDFFSWVWWFGLDNLLGVWSHV